MFMVSETVSSKLKVVLISNEFPPIMSSGAAQMRDLAEEFSRAGYDVTVLTSVYGETPSSYVDEVLGIKIIRFSALPTKGVGYFRRTINEILAPRLMLRNIKRSSLNNVKWHGVIWYSPTIFLGPVAKHLKSNSGCQSYLIVRDLFPDWAVDMGLMGRGLPYKILKFFERQQYSAANIIGVQAEGNLPYFSNWASFKGKKIEVLNNWLSNKSKAETSIIIERTELKGRRIFVYAGNMGIAQGLAILFSAIIALNYRKDIGFLFVGRGSEMDRFKKLTASLSLSNVVFFDHIGSNEIPALYQQCHIGMLSLDLRHKTHNIPGKFLSYMISGLPVIAVVNPGNDLFGMITKADVGRVVTDEDTESLVKKIIELIEMNEFEIQGIRARCKTLSDHLFKPEIAVKQITKALGI